MRYHANAAAASSDGALAAADWRGRLPAALTDVAHAVATAAQTSAHGSTLYTGRAGVAFALSCAARCDASLLTLATREAAAAAAAPGLQRRTPTSVMDGLAGVALAQLLVASAAGDQATPDDASPGAPLPRFATCCEQAASPGGCNSDEVLYGRSGMLLGALILNRQLGRPAVGEATLAAICSTILQSGRSTSSSLGLVARGGPPLFYTWPEPGGRGDAYLGAAHGLAGIVYALMHGWRAPDLLPTIDAGARRDVLAALDFVLLLECGAPGRASARGHWPVMCQPPSPRDPVLVHWCHGAPGIAMVAAKAFEVTGERRYLEAAVRAGELVWERGLLTKGPGLCHGISGNAYALLAVWRATGDPLWRARAECFAAFIAETGGGRVDWGAPDHPFSLFEGLAGALCLLSDLVVDPEGARFPFFEV